MLEVLVKIKEETLPKQSKITIWHLIKIRNGQYLQAGVGKSVLET
jgi:hypothetical protein